MPGGTPGPWSIKPFDESQTCIVGPEYDGGKMELVAVVSVGKHRPHGEANARLIASAPDLQQAVDTLKAEKDREIERLRRGVEVIAENCLSRAGYIKGSVGAELEEVANSLYDVLQPKGD